MGAAVKKAKKVPRGATKKVDGEAAVLAKIREMPAPYRAIGERLHEIIMESTPGLAPKVRYGMPWYMKDGKSWCFFRAAQNFNFVTLGFDDPANITRRSGAPEPLVASAYRIRSLDELTEAKLSVIVREAAS